MAKIKVTGSLGTPFENQAFSVTPGATEPDTFLSGGTITYSLVSGSLPSGLTLNSATSEISGTSNGVDLLSNGFKQRASGQGQNASGNTYIFAAFAESPFKTARAR